MTTACPSAIIASTAVICDNACKLPIDTQLPWVMIANMQDIRTTMLTVTVSGGLRPDSPQALPHQAPPFS